MHAVLLRQLKKLGADRGRVPTEEQWRLFLDRVEQTFVQGDQDRYMLDRSLEASSEEMQSLYDQLRQASEAELAKKSAQLETSLSLALAIQESVAEGIVVCDGDQVLRWNRRFAEMWQIPENILAESTMHAFITHACTLVKSPHVFMERATLEAREDGVRSNDVELTDGRIFARYAAPISRVEGVVSGRITCFRDVTDERRVAAERAVVAERMAAVGQLVASVAHEINNPLAYVKGNIEFVAGELTCLRQPLEDPLLEALADACVGVDRITVIVRDLRALSRVDEETRALVDVEAVLESALQMSNNQIRHRARITRHRGPVPRVMANEGRLVQVFLNLLVNASQAIEAGRASDNEIAIATSTTSTGAARVEIRDTGSGIAPHCVERIFDPFFTTKALGNGTGLGLSICKGIVEKLGGTIGVVSTVGHGSCFAIELPAGAALDTAAPAIAPLVSSAILRILVVDDDAMVRRMLARMLGAHVVVTATSVDEGVAALSTAEFDLVLCDVMMPDRTGLDMHAEVQCRWPELLERLVFMSGGAFTPALRAFIEQPSIALLDKPLCPRAVNETVTRVAELARGRDAARPAPRPTGSAPP